jgi:hypothetical protein
MGYNGDGEKIKNFVEEISPVIVDGSIRYV